MKGNQVCSNEGLSRFPKADKYEIAKKHSRKCNMYVEIKQFPKAVKELYNKISTVILLIKFLVYQRDLSHLQGIRILFTYLFT